MRHQTILATLLCSLCAAMPAAAATIITPHGPEEVFSRGDLLDLQALMKAAGAATSFSRAAGSFTATLGDHVVQFTPGGSLAVVDGRLTSLPGPVRLLEGRSVASRATAAALLVPLGWALRETAEGLQLAPVTGAEQIAVSQVRAAEGTLIVLRGCSQRPRLTSVDGGILLHFAGPVELARPVIAEGELLGGALEAGTLTLRLAPGVEVASTYSLDDPPRFVIRLAAIQATAPVQQRGPGPLVVLDPGHGGDDRGARGPAGELEKDITLAVARMAGARLQALGVTVRLTREGDETVALADRTALANRLRADAFLSVHANASPARGARGAETYFMSAEASDIQAAQAAAEENAQAPPDTVQLILWDLAQVANLNESARLARAVAETLNTLHGTHDRGIKQAPFLVLTGATMPAALVELGFLSNADDAARLTGRSGQEELAAALADAIVAFLQAPRATPTPPP